MKVWRKARRFLAYTPRQKRMLAEAWLLLAWARFLKLLPFASAIRLLGASREETPHAPDPAEAAAIRQTGAALLIMSRHTWWTSNCLVLAMAGMAMLSRRGIESTMYLGTARDPRTGGMIAHAWLRSGPWVVTGAKEIERYTVVAVFGRSRACGGVQRSVSHGS